MKTQVIGTHYKCLNEALLMSTHNMWSHHDSLLEAEDAKLGVNVTKSYIKLYQLW